MENSENNESTEQLKTENGSDSGDALLTDTNATKPDGAVKAELSTEEKALENVEKSEDSMENLLDMYEESFNRFREGKIVTGTIIALDKEHVLVDIGYKSEGRIAINEFKDEHNDININLGDSVEVMVEKW
ncbi:MAG: S1 RNA-binding domain-containing protein, partial [Desulfobacterales bacterium]|nr:S1 RNA-binding domain-containing protein [Desulfobacterales bacterium]